jgi:hypothetical protein
MEHHRLNDVEALLLSGAEVMLRFGAIETAEHQPPGIAEPEKGLAARLERAAVRRDAQGQRRRGHG